MANITILKDWSEVASSRGCSLDTSNLIFNSCNYKEYASEAIEILDEIIEEPKSRSISLLEDDEFDTISFLNNHTNDIIDLECKKDKLLMKALDFNFEAATLAFAQDCISRKLRLGSLISQKRLEYNRLEPSSTEYSNSFFVFTRANFVFYLEQILDGSIESEVEEKQSEEEYSTSDIDLVVGTGLQDTDTESSMSCSHCGGFSLKIVQESLCSPEERKLYRGSIATYESTPSITFELEEDVAEKWVTILHKQFRDFESKEETRDKVLELGTPETIEVVLRILRLYINNTNITVKCGSIIKLLAGFSKQSCGNIFNLKHGLEIICECFNRTWPNRDAMKSLVGGLITVFFHASWVPHLIPLFQRDDCLDLLLKPSEAPGYFEYDVLSVVAAVNLIKLAASNWTFRKSRETVDTIILKGISKWQIGAFRPVDYGSFYHTLIDLQSENLAIQQFSAWILANETTIYPQRHCATIKKHGGVPVLEKVLDKEDCNPEVARLVRIVLEKMNMSEGLIYIAHEDTL